MGMIPLRLQSPTVGFMPTIPQRLAGETIDPSVSVPMAIEHKFAATATAEPELEPEALRSSTWGLRVNPPRALHPLVDREPRKLAHSLRLVFPSSTAPDFRSFPTMKASRWAVGP